MDTNTQQHWSFQCIRNIRVANFSKDDGRIDVCMQRVCKYVFLKCINKKKLICQMLPCTEWWIKLFLCVKTGKIFIIIFLIPHRSGIRFSSVYILGSTMLYSSPQPSTTRESKTSTDVLSTFASIEHVCVHIQTSGLWNSARYKNWQNACTNKYTRVKEECSSQCMCIRSKSH